MAFGTKPDLPPLLAPGRHRITLDDIFRMAVANFNHEQNRSNLYYKLEISFKSIWLRAYVVKCGWMVAF